MLRTLSATDLCVGLVSEPLIVAGWLSGVFENWNICHHALSLVFLPVYVMRSVSLMVLTAVSVDRPLAVMLRIRYRQIVTMSRTRAIVTTTWGISLITASMHFCDYHQITLWFGNIGISLCLAISICCYTKIFINLHTHQIQVKDLVDGRETSVTNQLNIARYKKAVSNVVWLQLSLVLCYHGIVGTLWRICKSSPSLYLAKDSLRNFL